jgi:hypothetical protein
MVGRRLRAAGAAAALPLLLASCATVIAGTTQEIAIETDPSGASCGFTRGNEGAVVSVQTPGKVTVQRRKEVMQVTCTRDGYEPATETVESTYNGATVGNVLLGGLIGVAVDAASGANNSYPDRIMIVMTPSSFPDAASRDAYFEKAAERIRQTAASTIKTIRDQCSSSRREFCQIDVNRVEEARDRALVSIEQKRAAARIAQARP